MKEIAGLEPLECRNVKMTYLDVGVLSRVIHVYIPGVSKTVCQIKSVNHFREIFKCMDG